MPAIRYEPKTRAEATAELRGISVKLRGTPRRTLSQREAEPLRGRADHLLDLLAELKT